MSKLEVCFRAPSIVRSASFSDSIPMATAPTFAPNPLPPGPAAMQAAAMHGMHAAMQWGPMAMNHHAMAMSGEQASGPPVQRISSSITYVYKVPKCHQLDGIAAVDPALDPTLTGKMELDEIAVCVWLLTRIRPDFKVCDLRVELSLIHI